jgi:hypothetical protein
MVILTPYGHSLRYIHHTGILGGLNHPHQSLQYFIRVLDDPIGTLFVTICDHKEQMPTLNNSFKIIIISMLHSCVVAQKPWCS